MADRAVVASGPFAVRVISAIVLGIPTVAAIVWGRPVLEAWLAMFVVLMGREWHELCGGRGWTADRLVLMGGPLLVLILATIDRYQAALLVTILGVPVLYTLSRLQNGLRPWFIAAGLPYVGLAALALSWLRAAQGPIGLLNLLWVFGLVWATDSAAYLVGRRIGGPKLAPRISPGKTWSGAIGGMLGAGVVGLALALSAGADPWLVVIASFALSVVAQVGDLVESAVKRRFGVKDSGAIIPGHGGLFDRADALLAAAPGAALALSIVGADALWR